MFFNRLFFLGMVALAGCQQIPKDVDVAPVDDPRDRGELAVEYEICLPRQRIELKTMDVDVSSYLKALDESLNRVPIDERDSSLKDGLPPMSASGHMNVRYAGSSLTAIDLVWHRDEVIKHSKEGVDSAGGSIGGDLRDVTVAQQPVFFYSELRFDDMRGISVEPDPTDRNPVTYWFVPPKASLVPAGKFTPWQAPVSVETPDWQEAHKNWTPVSWGVKAPGRGLPIAGDTAGLPKVRYRLITTHEFYQFDKPWRSVERWLPSLIARQYSVDVKASAQARDVVEFVRPHREDLPACD